MANSLKLFDPNNVSPEFAKWMRFDSRQELTRSILVQKTEAQIQAEAIGNRISLDALSKFDAENEPMAARAVNRVCSLCLQLAINWALSRTSFSVGPLKSDPS